MSNLNVFISGTQDDLVDYREAVRDVVYAFDLLPTLMEYFNPLDDAQVYLDAVSAAGIYLGIYAHSYGICPPGSKLSISEMEFDRAVQQGIPRYCFLLDRNMPWPSQHMEGEPGQSRLRRFRTRMRDQADLLMFTTPESLQVEVARVLRDVRRQRPRINLEINPVTIVDILPPAPVPGNFSTFKMTLTCRDDLTGFKPNTFRNALSNMLKLPRRDISVLEATDHTLTVTLPTRPALKLHSLAFEKRTPTLTETQEQRAPSGQGERILVIDDSTQMRKLVGEMLEPHFYELLFAENGLDGLEMAQNHYPDLILLDLQLPDIDGIEVLDRLRSGQMTIPVILMTGHGTESIAVEVFRKGVKDYLIKGFSELELLAAIEERGLAEHRLRKSEMQLRKHTSKLTARLKDVTQETKTGATQSQLDKVMGIVNSIGKSVTELIDTSHLMARVVGAALMTVGSDESNLYLLQNDALYRYATIHDNERNPNTTIVPVDDPVVRWTIEHNQTVMLTPETIARSKWNDRLPLMSALSVPLSLANQCIGALVVKNIGADAAPFSRFEATVLSVLADYTAIALENASHYPESNLLPPPQWDVLARENPIFISYSRENWHDYVVPLVAHLEQQGFNVWVDQHLLQGGQDWLDKINEALNQCSTMILCVSPAAVQSTYVKLEYRYFIHERKPLIPLICEPCVLPAELLSIQHIPFSQTDVLLNLLRQLTLAKRPA